MAQTINKAQELLLIARCIAADDRNAFGQLVVAYESGLRRFLLNLTSGDIPLTDDLSQETFLKAYLAIRSFKGIASFKTWLYRIAYNEFISYKRRYMETDDIDDKISVEATDNVAQSDAEMDLKVCLNALNDTERTLVHLFYIEDLPIKKVCEITGHPEGTVKSYLSRARAKMAEVINK